MVVSCALIQTRHVVDTISRHLMTGMGAYYYIVWAIWLRHCLDGHQWHYDLIWPRLITSFPRVVKRQIEDPGAPDVLKKTK